MVGCEAHERDLQKIQQVYLLCFVFSFVACLFGLLVDVFWSYSTCVFSPGCGVGCCDPEECGRILRIEKQNGREGLDPCRQYQPWNNLRVSCIISKITPVLNVVLIETLFPVNTERNLFTISVVSVTMLVASSEILYASGAFGHCDGARMFIKTPLTVYFHVSLQVVTTGAFCVHSCS